GIIPGSMATPGFFVEGQCNEADAILEHPSLNSAAHGSGRVLGRKRAIETLDANSVRKQLAKRGVTLLGGGLDEAPGAYKASRKVIAAQSDLVRVWAEFEPAIVRMAGDSGKTLGEKTGDLTWERRKKRKGKRRR
ncbi:MAG: RtcB family protein, partial [Methylococcales bacterium]|nr:RtcB family protein [Methylococcales bacterium]